MKKYTILLPLLTLTIIKIHAMYTVPLMLGGTFCYLHDKAHHNCNHKVTRPFIAGTLIGAIPIVNVGMGGVWIVSSLASLSFHEKVFFYRGDYTQVAGYFSGAILSTSLLLKAVRNSKRF